MCDWRSVISFESKHKEQYMNGLTKICMLVSTISLALLAADTWLWTLIDLSNNEDDLYEMHLQLHEEMDSQ
jgi:hypothetical protein